MKKRNVLFLSLIVILSLSGSALAADDTIGIYVAATGGVTLPQNMLTKLDDTTEGVTDVTHDIGLNTGWMAGAKVGWLTPFSKRWFAAEIEYNHIENNFNTGSGYRILEEAMNFDGKIKLDVFMLNLIGRYPAGRIHPFVGFGFGAAQVQLDDLKGVNVNPDPANPGGNNLDVSGGHKWVFAYQGMAGVDFDITKNLFVGVAYKFLVTQPVKYDARMTTPMDPGVSDPGTVEAQYKSHNIVLTIGYLF